MSDLRNRLCEVLGEFSPNNHIHPNTNYQVNNAFINKGISTQEILISVDEDDYIPAFLLYPPNITEKNPGILCLHQTTIDNKIGAREAAGIMGESNYYYAFELAKLGFVTIAPDYPLFGNYKISLPKIYDQYGYQSISMKAIINHMAAINVLQSLPMVDPSRIGCIGHSLGGTNTTFCSFFDHRIKAAAISAGFTTFRRYAETSLTNDLSKWASREKYMPNISIKFNNDYSKMPFDFPELLSSLIPKPVFVSIPKEDEIFDYSGAIECVMCTKHTYEKSHLSDKFNFVVPEGKHDFPFNARKSAYDFLQKELSNNGN